MSGTITDDYLTMRGTAVELGVSIPRVCQLRKRPNAPLPSEEVEGRVFFRREVVAAFKKLDRPPGGTHPRRAKSRRRKK